MTSKPVTQFFVLVRIEEGRYTFDPPGGPNGYQFTKGTTRGTIVFRLESREFEFNGCSFHPTTKDGMPGVEARWGAASRSKEELAATFDYPSGKLYEGHLHLFCINRRAGKSLVIDPQVGNDGETGEGP